jgi:pilus assembly protein Flp/PilA
MLPRCKSVRVKLQSFLRSDEGQDLVEYALVVGLLAIASVVALKSLATVVTGIFGTIKATLSAA